MLSKRYESTEVDRRTWLHVPSGTHWSTLLTTFRNYLNLYATKFTKLNIVTEKNSLPYLTLEQSFLIHVISSRLLHWGC